MTCRPGLVGRDLRRRMGGRWEGMAGVDGEEGAEEREGEDRRGWGIEVGKGEEREDEGKAVGKAG